LGIHEGIRVEMKKIQEDKKALENAIKKVEDIHERLKIQMEKSKKRKRP